MRENHTLYFTSYFTFLNSVFVLHVITAISSLWEYDRVTFTLYEYLQRCQLDFYKSVQCWIMCRWWRQRKSHWIDLRFHCCGYKHVWSFLTRFNCFCGWLLLPTSFYFNTGFVAYPSVSFYNRLVALSSKYHGLFLRLQFKYIPTLSIRKLNWWCSFDYIFQNFIIKLLTAIKLR